MKRMYVFSMVAMLLLSALLVVIPMGETAQAATLTVGSDQTYTTIQGAIDAASAGDIIKVNAGVYNEHLTISIPLTLIGNGTDETRIITDSSAPAITISSDYVNVSNMAISTQSRLGTQEYGIEILGGNSYTTLTNLHLFDNYYGVRSRGSSSSVHNMNTVIHDCLFEQNYYGVYYYYADNSVVTNSTFYGNYYSVYSYYNDYGVFENNSVFGQEYGIYSYYSDYAMIRNNDVNNAYYGLYVRGDYCTVESNDVDKGYYGIRHYYANYGYLGNNTFFGNYYGMYVYYGGNHVLYNNTVEESQYYGVYNYRSDYNEYHNNTFKDLGWPYNTDIGYYGVYLYYTDMSVWEGNVFENCGIRLYATSTASEWNSHSFVNNTVNGKPLYYIAFQNNVVVPSDAGQVIITDSTNVLVENADLSNSTMGVTITRSNYVTVRNSTMSNNAYGIYVYGYYQALSYISATNNTMTNNRYGIYYYGSSSNRFSYAKIDNNTVGKMKYDGIYLYYSKYSFIYNNTVFETESEGIYSYYFDDGIISHNNVHNGSQYGYYIRGSRNEFHNNTIADHQDDYGMYLYYLTYSNIHNNEFVRGLAYGARFYYADYNNIYNNSAYNTRKSSFYFYYADYNEIFNNTVTDPGWEGFDFYGANNNYIHNNTFNNCGFYFSSTSYLTGNTFDDTNLMNGKPFYMVNGQSYTTIPSTVGNLFIYNSNHVTIANATLTSVQIRSSSYITFENCSFAGGGAGIYSYQGSYLKIANSTFVGGGIYIDDQSSLDYWNTHSIYNNTVNGRELVYLVGQSGLSYTGNSIGQAILVQSNDIVIRGNDLSSASAGVLAGWSYNLTIENNDCDDGINGIEIYAYYNDANNIRIANNSLNNNVRTGVRFYSGSSYDASNVVIHNNSIDNNGEDGAYLYYMRDNVEFTNNTVMGAARWMSGYALYIYTSSSYYMDYLVVSGNRIDDAYYGLYTYYSNYGIFSDNEITNCYYGTYIRYASDSVVDNNLVHDNDEYGLRVYYGDRVTITNNTVYDNVGYGLYSYRNYDSTLKYNHVSGFHQYAFYLYYGYRTDVSYNTIEDGYQYGLRSYYADNAVITWNTIRNNQWYGIYSYYADYAAYYYNTFDNNGAPGYQNREYNSVDGTSWDNGYHGNWWSDWTSPDADMNGIVDIPYCPGSEYDRYPLIYGIPIVKVPEAIAFEDAFFTETLEYINAVGVMTWNFTTNASWLTLGPGSTISGTPTNDDVGLWWVEAEVTNSTGVGSSLNFTLEVVNTNDAPTITTTPVTALTEDVPHWQVFDAYDVDPTGDTMRWTITDTDQTFLSIGYWTGNLTGTPDNSDVGSWYVNLTVDDGNAGYDYINFTVTVTNVNDAPVITTADILTATENSTYYNDYNATDIDPTSDTLTWYMATNVTFLSINSATGVVTGTPAKSDYGMNYFLNVSVHDGNGGWDWHNFTFQVYNINVPPTITTSDNLTAIEDSLYQSDYDGVDIDPTSDVLTWHLNTNATFLSISSSTGLLSGTPVNSEVGTYWVNVSVDDGRGGLDWSNFTLTVQNTNDDPVINTSNVVAGMEDNLYTADYDAFDIDPTMDTLTWSVSSNATFLSIDAGTGVLSGTPDNSGVGTWWVNVTVSDGNGGLDWTNFTLVITNVNDDPLITTPNVLNATEDMLYSVDYDAIDIDPTSDVLTWSLVTDAGFLTIDSVTGVLSGMPTNDDVGTYSVNITVLDGKFGADWTQFDLTVENVNDPPTIDTFNVQTATEDLPYSVDYEASDIDPTMDTFTWYLNTNADFLTIDAGTGVLSGIPQNDDVGTWWVNVSVDDGNGGVGFSLFNLTVENTNDPPVITTTPVTDTDEDSVYTQEFAATDEDPVTTVFSWKLKTNAPFLLLDGSTVSGTPENDHVGDWWINISVIDDVSGVAWLNYTLSVHNTNDPPVITSKDTPVATEDELYEVTYTATDEDPAGDPLTWNVSGEAGFLTIDPNTGVLSGTPTNDDVGVWWVNVTVSDGNGGLAWSLFRLTVRNTNDPPEAGETPGDVTMNEDEVLEDLDITSWFVDIDGDNLAYGGDSSANITVKVTDAGIATITPAEDWSGTEVVQFSGFDGTEWVLVDLKVIVLPVNDAPTDALILGSDSVIENGTQLFSGSAEDVDLEYGDELTFTWSSDIDGDLGEGAQMNFSLSPGIHVLTLVATDQAGETTNATFTVDVEAVYVPPVVDDDDDDDNTGDDDDTTENKGSALGFILIFVIIAVVLLVVIALVIFFVMKKKKQDDEPEVQPEAEQAEQPPAVPEDAEIIMPGEGPVEPAAPEVMGPEQAGAVAATPDAGPDAPAAQPGETPEGDSPGLKSALEAEVLLPPSEEAPAARGILPPPTEADITVDSEPPAENLETE